VAERCAAPAGQKSIAVALALLTSDDALLRDVARTIVTTARHPDATPRPLWQTVPGIGKMLSLVLLDDIHNVHRVPRGQDVVSSCRLVTCARASAGKRDGTADTTIGKAHLQWAFAAAAVLSRSDHPAAQHDLARLEQKPDQGQALTILAQQLARAVYDRLTRQGACARETCFPREGRGADEPGAALDPHGMHLEEALERAACPAAVNAKAPLGHETLRPALGLDLRSRSWFLRRSSPTVYVCCSSPEPGSHGTTQRVEPALCLVLQL